MNLCVFKHENASLVMFDYLVDDNNLRPVMKQHGLVLPEDLDFIKEQIAGPLDTNAAQGQKVTFSSAYVALSVNQKPIYSQNMILAPCKFESYLKLTDSDLIIVCHLRSGSTKAVQKTSPSFMRLWPTKEMALMWISGTTLPGGVY